jgi:hypothetical protein
VKKIQQIIAFSAVILCLNMLVPQSAEAQGASVSLQVFYDQLSPYGRWANYPNYGYVWMPNADANFTPYSTNGHWVLTDAGWTWVSDYDWGWAPFHYGRWSYDDNNGWFWVPDTQWGPAWVSWRQSSDYYGWAPLAPGVSLGVAFGAGYNSIPSNRWCFVRQADMIQPNLNNYYVNRTQNVTIIQRTTVIKNTYVNSRHVTYVTGPSQAQVQNVVHRQIPKASFNHVNTPGRVTVNNNKVNIYRPVINKTTNVIKPTKVVTINNTREDKPFNNAPRPATQPARTPAPQQQHTPVQTRPATPATPTRTEPTRTTPARPATPTRTEPTRTPTTPVTRPVNASPRSTNPVTRSPQTQQARPVQQPTRPVQQQQTRPQAPQRPANNPQPQENRPAAQQQENRPAQQPNEPHPHQQ